MEWRTVRERLIFQMDNAGSHYFRIHPKRSINATGKTVHLPALITKAMYRRVVLMPLSEQLDVSE